MGEGGGIYTCWALGGPGCRPRQAVNTIAEGLLAARAKNRRAGDSLPIIQYRVHREDISLLLRNIGLQLNLIFIVIYACD